MPIMTELRRKLPILKTRTESESAPAPSAPQAAVVDLSVDDIIPNRAQPRTAFHQNAIARLADSIRRYGILQPLTVRKVLLPSESHREGAPSVRYELVAGERRLRAAKLAEMTAVPCIIINTDDATSAELAIIENLLREDLNMFEQAEAFSRLIREFHLTQDEAARRVSMSQSAVANKLRILRLLPEERQKILEAGLTERHARALLKLSDPTLRGDVLRHILERRLNVSATEAYIDRLLTDMARYQSRVGTARGTAPQDEPASVWTAHLRDAAASDDGTVPAQALECGNKPDKAPAKPSECGNEPDGTPAKPSGCGNEPDETPDEVLPSAIRGVISARKSRFKGSIKDLRLFYNSVQNAVDILASVGVSGHIERQESEERVVLIVTLTKMPCEGEDRFT